MAYDGVTMYLVRRELQELLTGARVEKINQPDKLTIILQLRKHNTSHQLLCSADPRLARIHLYRGKAENPPAAPAFCMLLRKHLAGARLLSVAQDDLERIMTFVFQATDEFGIPTEKKLICEIMGKHSNLILVKTGKGQPATVLGSIKAVNEEMSRYRVVLPGAPYYPPPAQNKLDLFALDEEQLTEIFAGMGKIPPTQALVRAVLGIGKDLAEEIVSRCCPQGALHPLEVVRPLTIALREVAVQLAAGRITPSVTCRSGEKPRLYLFSPAPESDPAARSFSSINAALADFYSSLAAQEAEKAHRQQLLQIIRSGINRTEKKLRLQETELREMENAGRYRIFGELLTANLHLLKTGMDKAEVPNYYDEHARRIVIPLEPSQTPQENAQRYFKKYRKLRDGRQILERRVRETREDLAYLESLLVAVSHADLPGLLEIREEMEQAGFIQKKDRNKAPAKLVSQPLHFRSPDGIDIFVGKNNKQNDRLTLRTAHKEYIWLHVKDLPGSHVIVCHSNPPVATLYAAASLAAGYSKAAASANVPVDYTKVKYVKKPKGAKPGMVVYTNQKTIYVTPKQSLPAEA